tara:strand:- start:850 stop:1146 length:297 start_codon:yes stop_codon:yes gene_type:complete
MVYNPSATEANQFERLGHPGRYTSVTLVSGATDVSFTGSNYGYGACMVSASYTGRIFLGDGGEIDGSTLAVNTVYDFSVSHLSGSLASDAIYVFKRQS